MRIYLMRHAHAAEPATWAGSDATRPLSPAGVSRLEEALSHMRRLKMSAEALLTSPFERAAQTAEVIARELHILQTFQCPELAAGARLDAFKRLVMRHATASSIWIVGHMPDLCAFTSYITGEAAALERSFDSGEMAAAECADASSLYDGTLLWRRRLGDWATA